MRETVETTYADLRPTDLVIDKSGHAWPIAELGPEEPVVGVNFWLCDPVTGVKMHYMTKLRIEPVKVSRLPTQADEASKLEADFPKPLGDGVTTCETCGQAYSLDRPSTGCEECMEWRCEQAEDVEEAPGPDERAAQVEAALAIAGIESQGVVAELLGGTVEAEVTAEDVDAAAAATDDAPVSLPPFADMTPLEQRSHLYLLHGLYGSDVTGKAELIAIHDQAHAQHDAGTLQSRHVPHVHQEA